jgi:hypothetical protein
MNLPQSAERDYMSTVYPDWDKLTDTQRDAYHEEEGARFRELARQRLLSDTSQKFNLDFTGSHGPSKPQRVAAEALHIEDRIAQTELVLRQTEGKLSAAGKLYVLESWVDWSLTNPERKEAVLARNVDFKRVTPEQLKRLFETLAEMKYEMPDSSVTRRLFEKAHSLEQSRSQETKPEHASGKSLETDTDKLKQSEPVQQNDGPKLRLRR